MSRDHLLEGSYEAAVAEQLGRIAQLLLEIRDELRTGTRLRIDPDPGARYRKLPDQPMEGPSK